MPRRYYSSTAARTTLASGVNNSTTTLSVAAVSGWPSQFPYTLIIDQDTVNEEIVEVSARSGTTLTVTRGVDGTSAVAHDAGAAVNHGVSGRDFDEPNAFINGTGTVTETLLATGSVTEAKLATNSVSAAKIVDGTITDSKIGASAAIAQSKISGLTSDLAAKLDYALPTNAQTGTTYTFVLADAERLTTASNGSAVTLTIPPQTSVTWAANSVLRVVNYGAGAVTINGGSGVTVTNTASTIAQYGAAVAIRTGSNAWTVVPFGGGDIPPADFSDSATGTYTASGISYKYITYNASGTLTITDAGLIDVVIAGGGAGGGQGSTSTYPGGGGGAGVLRETIYLEPATYTVTVGAGGAAGGNGRNGKNGAGSSLKGFAGAGGGGGSGGGSTGGPDGGPFPGGCGGGGSGGLTGAVGIPGQGFAGANASGSTGGGGGGATAVGTTGGAGGAGYTETLTNTSIVLGAGGAYNSSTSGGANTGNGGGGHSSPGAGGSGRVIVRVRT